MTPRTPRQTGQITPSAPDPRLPTIPKALLDALKLRYPNRRARIGETIDRVWYVSGQISVIEYLEEQFDLQNAVDSVFV